MHALAGKPRSCRLVAVRRVRRQGNTSRLTGLHNQTRLGLVKTVNIQEAKTHLSRLLERAANGEQVVIAKAGKPIAVLSAWQPESAGRTGGGWKGRGWIADDFDAPSTEIEALFEETPGEPESLVAKETPLDK